MLRRVPLLALLTISRGAFALEPAPPIVGARSLALSPDGTRIAFAYRGDVWVAPSTGGQARPLTTHPEMDDNPVWSPDGKRLAFASNRYGSWDAFVVDVDGGATRRVTLSSGSEVPTDWMPDGKEILVRTNRDASENGIYAINVESGAFRPLLLDFMTIGNAKMSPEGDKVLYTRFGFPTIRPRYRGSAAAQLWTYDLKSGKRTALRNNGFQHLWPSWSKSGIWAVTVTEGAPSTAPLGKSVGKVKYGVADTPNAYKFTLAGGASRRTARVGDAIDSVRYLASARDAEAFAFESGGDVYVSRDGSTPEKIAITLNEDDRTAGENREVVTGGAEGISLSPDGSNVVFGAKRDLWRVPVKKGEGPNKDDAERLTDWAGFDEEPLYAPDGKAVFFVSDREGAERLYRMDLATKEAKAITREDADITSLALTPDRKGVAFWRKGAAGGLYVAPVEGGEAKRVFARPGANPIEFAFSPDGRWVAYTEDVPDSGYYYWDRARNVIVVNVATGESRDVTQLGAQHYAPAWSADGKFLYLGSDREGSGIYAIPLQKEAVRGADDTIKWTKPTAPVKVEIVFDRIEERVRKLASAESVSNLRSDAEDGSLLYISGGDVYRANADAKEPKKLTNGGGIGGFEVSPDGKSLVFVQNGALQILNLRAPNTPVTTVAFRGEWSSDAGLERKAAFAQLWREYNRGFYDPNFHGRDWVAIRPKYERLLPSVGHQMEFAGLAGAMIGELESSHSEVSAYSTVRPAQGEAHLGFLLDYAYGGPGLKVKSVPDRSPWSYERARLNPGDVVTKINGKPVSVNESLFPTLAGQIGREITYTVRGSDGKERMVTARGISGGEFGALIFRNRIEARRRYVEQKSGGALTYVQIPGMGGAELTRFQQQMWQYAREKKGVIIDVRNNGGGNTSDQIIDILERRQNAYYQLRDEAPIRGPGQALGIPLVVMMNETSYSNAEMFPSSMKSRKLATLVGKPTPGYVIYTYGLRLADGTNARMPSTGVYRLDGSPLENDGERPDYEVEWTPEQYFAGADPQLDKAIEVLLKQAK